MEVEKEYRDPLYGFVALDKIEQAIVETPCFQRLRRITHLGTTHLVYPSANHTRFEHSLGTVHAISSMLTVLSEPLRESLGWSDSDFRRYRSLARLAALTHDLGHPPFSHSLGAELFPKEDGTRLSHEDYSFKLTTTAPVSTIIDEAFREGGSSVAVAGIATGRATRGDEAFLSELLTGDFGADRVDYLLRDSYHLGVQYGKFDLHRLLNTLKILPGGSSQGPVLAVDKGGLHTVEAFLLARYFMFLEVYFHKTRRVLDHHLTDFLRDTLPAACLPADTDAYLSWDDSRVLETLRIKRDTEEAARITARKHYRLAWESSDHPGYVELERLDWLKERLEDKYGSDKLYVDEATKSPYSFDRPPILVWDRDQCTSLTERSPLVAHLKRIEKYRIYTAPDIRHDAEETARLFWRKREELRGGSQNA